jgi:signal transduction histidine kinase
MRALIKKAPAAHEPVAINTVIQEVLALTQPELRRNRVLLQTEFADDLPIVLGDKIQLQQVILNLVMNAIEAMNGIAEGARELQVSSQRMTGTRFDPGKETVPAGEVNEPGQSFVLIAVRDSGPGLDPAQLDRFSRPSIPPSLQGWAWAWPLAVLLLKPIMVGCGAAQINRGERSFSLLCHASPACD